MPIVLRENHRPNRSRLMNILIKWLKWPVHLLNRIMAAEIEEGFNNR